jgi:hypothetical protein
MIRVVITTCERPFFLRQALLSISTQTVFDKISMVVVSENGGSRLSEQICKEFPKLPIHYIFQEPCLPRLEHFRIFLGRNCEAKYTAILHDDDFWLEDHLEKSIETLDSKSGCVAVFSNFFEVSNPAGFFELPAHLRLLWLVAGCDFSKSILKLSREEVLLGSMLWPCFHYSTAVGRTEVFSDAFQKVIESENEYDNDRLFPTFVSAHGPVAFLTRPNVLIRKHPNQHSLDPELREKVNGRLRNWEIRFIKTTLELCEREPNLMSGAAELFNRRAGAVSVDEFREICDIIQSFYLKEVYINKCGLRLNNSAHQQARNWKWFLKECCPPAGVKFFRYLVQKLIRDRVS